MGPAMGLLYKYLGDSVFNVLGIIGLLVLIAINIYEYITSENESAKLKYALYSLLYIIGLIIIILLILF
jgi:hypothetical protein